ncbi:MAG: MFS transporter [Bacteroidales bacterium]|jgi:MFS family permease|nr:MFS transporter [Bacteroidales bacterium]
MKKRYLILVLIVSLGFITFLDRVALASLATYIKADLFLDKKQWGWVMGLFILAYALFQIPMGNMGDRRGHRSIIAVLVVWWSIFTFLTGLATGYYSLLIISFFFGMGEAGVYPCISGVIARWFPSTQRARAQGFVWAASRLGGGMAAVLLIGLAESAGWRVVFYLLSTLGILWTLAWLSFYRNSPAEMKGISTEELSETGGHSSIGTKNVPWQQILRARQFWLILGMYWFYVWGSTFYFSWLHTFLAEGRGFSSNEVRIAAALPFFLGAFSNSLGGMISDRLSNKHGLKFGRRAIGVSCLFLASVFFFITGITESKLLTGVYLALGFGIMDIMLPSAWAVCLDVGHRNAGAISGAMNMAGNLGGFMCSIMVGYVASSAGYNAPLFIIAGMLLVSSMLFLQINPEKSIVNT